MPVGGTEQEDPLESLLVGPLLNMLSPAFQLFSVS